MGVCVCVCSVNGVDCAQEFRAFELLRSGRDRSRYLLIKEAKIIAMTCTHAALKRRDLVEAGFQYDNILMEESAQILEIETFIPLLCQVHSACSRIHQLAPDKLSLPPPTVLCCDLVEAGFQYNNILMEEATQIQEIETFIPLLCQVLCSRIHQLAPGKLSLLPPLYYVVTWWRLDFSTTTS